MDFRIECDERTVFVSEYDDGVFLKIGSGSGGTYTTMTREQAQQLIEAVQSVLKETEHE